MKKMKDGRRRSGGEAVDENERLKGVVMSCKNHITLGKTFGFHWVLHYSANKYSVRERHNQSILIGDVSTTVHLPTMVFYDNH